MSGLVALGLLPLAALAIALGHVLTVDSVGPATGGLVSLLALVSGTWFPITGGFLYDVGRFLPSWWIVQAGRIGIGESGWSALGWAVVAAWTVIAAVAGAFAYRRDSGRV
jgi:ABC-2 type transport system permease protein